MDLNQADLIDRQSTSGGPVSVETAAGKITVYGRGLTVGLFLGMSLQMVVLGVGQLSRFPQYVVLFLPLACALLVAAAIFRMHRRSGEIGLVPIGWATAGAGFGFMAGLGISLAFFMRRPRRCGPGHSWPSCR